MSEKINTFNIFVYGTLKKGNGLHYLLKDSEYLGTFRLSGFQMYDNISYPYTIVSDNVNDTVEAELYRIDYKTLKSLDKVEGVPNHYKRISISSPFEGYIYIVEKEKVKNLERIIDGVW